MKQIKNFVQKNQMTVMAAVVVVMFSMWMYSAHRNMEQREARIEQVIENGGTHHPSADLTVDNSYVANRQNGFYEL